ncbi:NAD(P)H-dependent glycerol-3-phosphate dehydrogenase [Kangiella sp. HZ709]|uniref:NAD(P)H-dependent glycerol-3-phosphate dehydrogenase n=1 Tax=Kangiella sp. HZ709 TaxID=2666328 RepID=UPI0012AFFEAA|nr:NAD(P)H-dependent glycerol-3-phosphate dehydrogenase [Kangiella sp. HZ709]MRX28237.1 NAD(P)H-dependent glycerol-3-phosphate dehydrogenase [Kangiella sp. HZ709]
MAKSLSIAVLGAGSYGTALAVLLANNGNQVTLWARKTKQVAQMQQDGANQQYLPDVSFPENLFITDDLPTALNKVDTVLISVPSHAFKKCLEQARPYLDSGNQIVWASKGLDPETGDLLGTTLESILGFEVSYAILSGPTFAKEMAMGMPTAITLASKNKKLRKGFAKALHNERFRVYLSKDVVGVQIGGAVKNVIAIGAGIADGLGFGANARTALITRGLAEMMRLGKALGGKRKTFNGMAGMGDLVLTCTDNQSRNRRFGMALGKGKDRAAIEAEIGQVVEGVRNAKEVKMLAERTGVEMPICQAIYQIIYKGVDPKQVAHQLLTRDLKRES